MSNNITLSIKYIVSLMLLVLVAGCGSTPKPKVDYNEDINFSTFKAFYFDERKVVNSEVNPVLQSRIGKVISSVLKEKPLSLLSNDSSEKQSKTTLAVNFHYTQTVKPQSSSFSIGIGGSNMGSRGGTSVGVSKSIPIDSDSLLITKITVDLSNQGKAIWHGSDIFEGENDLPQAEKDKLIKETVKRLLSEFPPSKN